jgi:hypothetical protein
MQLAVRLHGVLEYGLESVMSYANHLRERAEKRIRIRLTADQEEILDTVPEGMVAYVYYDSEASCFCIGFKESDASRRAGAPSAPGAGLN